MALSAADYQAIAGKKPTKPRKTAGQRLAAEQAKRESIAEQQQPDALAVTDYFGLKTKPGVVVERCDPDLILTLNGQKVKLTVTRL